MIGPMCAACEIEDGSAEHESCAEPLAEIELPRLRRVERPLRFGFSPSQPYVPKPVEGAPASLTTARSDRAPVWRQLGARRPPVEL